VTAPTAGAATAGLEDGWIEWPGGECPVPAHTPVEVRYRDGETELVYAHEPATGLNDWWKHEGETCYDPETEGETLEHSCDIVAYRVVPA